MRTSRILAQIGWCTAFAIGAAALFHGAALAQDSIVIPAPPGSSPFAAPADTDIAYAWIDFFLHDNALPDGMATYGKSLGPLADGLRRALGLYNIGMLVIGALLLFYYITEMIVSTAHTGAVMGRRANKVWAPIRLVFAIGLLIPISTGLSAGQLLVTKIAELGSSLASNAWQSVASSTADTLATIVTPRPPNVAALVSAALEMELCHVIYQQAYLQYTAQAPNDATLALMGPMPEINKFPAGRLAPETWRYSNTLNANAPLCGEFHFGGYRPDDFSSPGIEISSLERAGAALSTFAHLEGSDILTQGSSFASRLAPVFLSAAPGTGVDIRSDLAADILSVQERVAAEIRESGVTGTHMADQVIMQSASAGWLAAANVIPELIRLQESYGELISHILPAAQEPLFDHPLLARQVLLEALDARGPTPGAPQPPTEGNPKSLTPTALYSQVSRIMALMHVWLYDNEMPKGVFVPASSLDLRDHLSAATDSSTAFGMFAAAFDTQAMADGVWGVDPNSVDSGYPFVPTATNAAYNPFTALAEFGRRQYQLGTYLMGLSGSAMTTPGAMAPAALAGLAALALLGGGLTLIFVVPFLPFFRFMIAALIWLLNLFEAIAAMPIVALAHISPTGEGLSGSTARQAYRLWVALMVRPLLALLGLILGFLLFTVAIGFFATALSSFARLSSTTNGSLLLVANVGLVLVFDIFAYAAVNASFRGIHWFPDQALRWLSQFTVTESNEPDQPQPVAGLPGAPATASASVTNLIAHQSMAGGAVNITGSTTASGASGNTTTHIHNMKAALFPSYQDKTITTNTPTTLPGGPPLALTTPNVSINVTGNNGPQQKPTKPQTTGTGNDLGLVKPPSGGEIQNVDKAGDKAPPATPPDTMLQKGPDKSDT